MNVAKEMSVHVIKERERERNGDEVILFISKEIQYLKCFSTFVQVTMRVLWETTLYTFALKASRS